MAPKQDTTSNSGVLPMFFRAPLALDPKRHANAGLKAISDLSFAKQTNSIAINAVEFFEAAKHYPIVFTGTDVPMPGIIVGLEQQNYFVDAKGRWKDGTYVPAYVRKYPFLFLDMPEKQQLMLCVDEGAPQFAEKGARDAHPLFEGEKPSALCSNALEFCKVYHQHYLHTQALGLDLKRANVLEQMQSNTKLDTGREIQLSGFWVVDEKKLAELPDATILDFHKRGVLPLLYAALLSGSNWKKLADIATLVEKNAA